MSRRHDLIVITEDPRAEVARVEAIAEDERQQDATGCQRGVGVQSKCRFALGPAANPTSDKEPQAT